MRQHAGKSKSKSTLDERQKRLVDGALSGPLHYSIREAGATVEGASINSVSEQPCLWPWLETRDKHESSGVSSLPELLPPSLGAIETVALQKGKSAF